MQQPLVAIVILNWNGKTFLQQFLPSVVASSYHNKKIIVADNASTDGSVEYVKTNFPGVEVLVSSKNFGFAGGYNYFLKQVEADYYVLLNSDVEVTPGWIEPVIELMEGNAQIAACQPKILSWHKKDEFEYAGASGGWLDAYGYPFSRGRLFDIIEKDNGQYNDAVPVFWATGAALFIKAKCYHQMNGFDEYFFAHMEEIDLCWRLQRSGYLVYVCPQSTVYHVGAGTLPKGSQRKVYLNFRNNLIMLTKNLPASQLIWKIPYRIFLDAISAWKELITGYPGYFTGIFKAHASYLHWLLTKRNRFKAPYPQLQGLYKGNIVWLHFAKGYQTFSQIVKKK
ncbi:MAG: glycosyltransferase family 2 protein [Chitinophagaceae bacterium]|nr:glycosyltransferase family 2 protein [Chitinophagaceae bacterium]